MIRYIVLFLLLLNNAPPSSFAVLIKLYFIIYRTNSQVILRKNWNWKISILWIFNALQVNIEIWSVEYISRDLFIKLRLKFWMKLSETFINLFCFNEKILTLITMIIINDESWVINEILHFLKINRFESMKSTPKRRRRETYSFKN